MVSELRPQKSKPATYKWTLDQLKKWCDFNPNDPAIQYIQLRLLTEFDPESLLETRSNPRPQFFRHPVSTNLFRIFSGAMAVQESLQLDAMLPDQGEEQGAEWMQPNQSTTPKHNKPVPISQLDAPMIESHPWRSMLKGKSPYVSKLAQLVPQDFYLVESGSTSKLMQFLSTSTSWQEYFSVNSFQDGTDKQTIEVVKKQLALGEEQMRLLESSDVEETVVTGSDLYLGDGSDITVMVLASPELIAQINSTSPSCAIAANPRPDLHIRSNSQTALDLILKSIESPTDALGASDEFRYVRSLMPWCQEEEDVFVYFSDAFVRRLVGPNLRIAQRRRLVCYSHLRMIAHEVMLYCSEHDKAPISIDELIIGTTPANLFKKIGCPSGGTYSLVMTDGASMSVAECTCHGRDSFMTPCLETPVDIATEVEANQYDAFVTNYNQYWRQYFDPIAVRVKLDDDKHTLETMVLPLIDNSIYTGLAGILGGNAPLCTKPVLQDAYLTGGVQLNREKFAALFTEAAPIQFHMWQNFKENLRLEEFLNQGIGDCVTFSVCDNSPAFSLDMVSLLGTNSMSSGVMANPMVSLYAWLLGSLHSPIFAQAQVQDAAVVDAFFERVVAQAVQKSGGRWLSHDICRIEAERKIYSGVIKFNPVRLRFFWARKDDKILIASQMNLLERLLDAKFVGLDEERRAEHAKVMLDSTQINKLLPDIHQTALENRRLSCRRNLGILTMAARAFSNIGASLDGFTENPILGARRLCPDGGTYSFDDEAIEDGVCCSVHGTLSKPVQIMDTAPQKVLPNGMKRATASLRFLEDGLWAKLEFDRR
ncbi:MAG: hypothetical protein SFY67_16510 [Candidatus Melainabacteria bacterium]|nr:hypothetical protein [Candidatus Melainabacteria bacterium]